MGYDIEKEKREAIEAGRRALNSLQAAKENLNSAKNWGLVDMFGGGFFTTMLKHSRIDQAKRNMEQAKYDLRNFSRELNDVNMVCNLNIDTGDFLSFADYFFDGFVVDWVVQDRINNAQRQVEEVILKNEGNVILSEGLVLQDADVWGKTLNETSTPFNNRMELYFEDFDIDGLLAKYESGKYFVRYATELTELAGGQKLVRLYDPSGNLIEVRTPFMCN